MTHSGKDSMVESVSSCTSQPLLQLGKTMILDISAEEVDCCPGVTICNKATQAEKRAQSNLASTKSLLAASAKLDEHSKSAERWGTRVLDKKKVMSF